MAAVATPLALTSEPSPEERRLEKAREELLSAGDAVGQQLRAHGGDRVVMQRLLRACREVHEARLASEAKR